MSKRDKMPSAEEPKRPDEHKPMRQVVELARRVLRERGLTDEQIEALLTRPKAPDNLN
ncbi:MAG TPA: hypothetical protein VFO00_10275 [Vitreimonas sp.]|nr:hypothetical protein [Vitreimonas sp.]